MTEYDYIAGYVEPGISVIEKTHKAIVEGTKVELEVMISYNESSEEYDLHVKDSFGDYIYVGSFPTDVAHKMLSSLNNHIPDIVPED